LPSLFEEQIELESQHLDHHLSHTAESHSEAVSYFPDLGRYHIGPEAYLEHLRRAKAGVGLRVTASLNGVASGGWVRHARLMEQAGADPLELNVYFMATDLDRTAAEIELQYLELARVVKAGVHIPVAMKLGHAFTAAAHFARRLDEAGLDARVVFNRCYQPDFDLERLEVVPTLTLSRSWELLLRLHWVAVLYGRIRADLAITGGVHTAADVLKAMMAGARVGMVSSARRGGGGGDFAPLTA